MSSEAAYFPNALARTAEVCREVSSCAESPTPSLHHALEEAAGPRQSDFTDEELLEQVRDGAKEALAHLFRRHARAVRNVASRILRDNAEADDLVQEVFLFIFRKAALYDPARGTASTWIIHITYNRAFDRRRYLNTRNFYSNLELGDAGWIGGPPAKDTQFLAHSIEGVLGKSSMAQFRSRLTPEQQETIELYFFEGYALREIADLTGRSLTNVRSHYYRGLERLRKLVLPEKLRSK